MLEIVIIGSGNVAQHLIRAFSESGKVSVAQVFARNPDSISHLIDSSKIIADFQQLKEVPVYIIAVSDKAIAEVSQQIPFQGKIVLHTSGALAITDLDAKNTRGAFYPLQTFTKDKEVDFRKIPVGIEIEKGSFEAALKDLAFTISESVFKITSEQRKALHVAAVFVCNFVNHLYKIGEDICTKNNIPFEILQPLILETADKITQLSPSAAQTGPAKRNDTTTINTHLQFLADGNKAAIYKLLTKSIIDNG